MSHVSGIQIPSETIDCANFVSGRWQPASGESDWVTSPYSGTRVGTFRHSTPEDVDQAVSSAKAAAAGWARIPLKERCQVMFRFREILASRLDGIAPTISLESGKTLAEARVGLLKGIEVLEFALSLQNLDDTARMEVSRGVHCELRREPLGVVAGITPFNFPAMVPMWMIPIAITLGNAFVWKPSEKTPLTSLRIAEALREAGLPPGILTVIQGGRSTVEAIIDHADVSAIGFVGSTPAARAVYQRAAARGKRALALGGAKNSVILMPDADPEMASRGIVDSFTGCAGQRCMAASLLIAVRGSEPIVEEVLRKAAAIRLGQDMGAIITRESRERLAAAVARAGAEDAQVVLDGRATQAPSGFEGGHWLAPTVIDRVRPGTRVASDELFGPVLGILHCDNLSQAIAIENSSPFGNAASVFTSSGAVAERVAQEARAGMIGINVGVPVPREPFSFGGARDSKFGHGDITGPSSLGFWSSLKKVTTKWAASLDKNWMN